MLQDPPDEKEKIMTIQEIKKLPREVNATRLKIIALLWRGEACCTEVSEFSEVQKATVTSLLDKMEKDGLTERFHRPGDRRRVYSRLTRKGRSLARKFIHEEDSK